ncbi:hypothetical protein GCM10009716_14960 [Streptomyces sodiiphilus]|uniref:4'-phosphopantetheinyl transferase domain-containing protein n=1 Tax=Streptomyces sodiiphilus TaxID=226217 RepID=A0ABN2P1C6_9ACTN
MRTGDTPLPAARRIKETGTGRQAMCADLARTGTALVYTRLSDWPVLLADEPAMCELLGHEAHRWAGLPRTPVRRRFALSRVLLKHALGAVIGAPAARIELAKRPSGSPYARGCDRVEVSLSHTDDVVLVGLSTLGPIGVDVERGDRRMARDALLREICTPAELAALRGLPDGRRATELIRLWTLKEAYSKAVGQGLRFPFHEFGFSPGEPDPWLCGPDGEAAGGGPWLFSTRGIEGEFTAGVAVLATGRDHMPGEGPLELLDLEAAGLLMA